VALEVNDSANMHESWHSLELEAVFALLESDGNGLSTEEVHKRQERYGLNKLSAGSSQGPLKRFLRQFNSALIYILIIAAVATALLGHQLDTVVILAVVCVNTLVGFIQEGKAERSLEAIRSLLPTVADGRRDGQWLPIAAEELVPGDVVQLSAGDKVPADIRIIQSWGLRIDEALLTGESESVEKGAAAVSEETLLADRSNMLFSGTLVVLGRIIGIVVATGSNTEIGQIGSLVSSIQETETPLMKKMTRFGHWLTGSIIVAAVVTFLIGWFLGEHEIEPLLVTTVALAVAAIPEGLPAIMTVALAAGVQRMAQRKAVIRRLPAVETLGSVNVICTDKTGTLTRNEMTVRSLVIAGCRELEITGTGYSPHGAFIEQGVDLVVAEDAHVQTMLRAAVLCNDARLICDDQRWSVAGDPTEGALIVAAMKGGIDIDAEREAHLRVDSIPFDSARQYMATLHRGHNKGNFLILKGAPEVILNLCTSLNNTERANWLEKVHLMAGRAERVLALASQSVEANIENISEELLASCELLGLFGMLDPPREEAISAVKDCHNASIDVKMITGDHLLTAQAIAQQLGITGDVIDGEALAALSEMALRERATSIGVFARTNPEQKLKIVLALQACQQVVAMTGDGVNDAPALKQADIGIAMGLKGSEAAKEASAMVLTDDNFASIAHAVEEGRTILANLRKTLRFFLPVNGGESGALLLAIVLGTTLPISPLQILWVNMISSSALSLTFVFSPPNPKVMSEKPHPVNAGMLSRASIYSILFVSLFFLAVIFAVFEWTSWHGTSIEQARTAAVTALVNMEVFYMLSVRNDDAPPFHLSLHKDKWPLVLTSILFCWGAQAFFIYAPVMHALLGTASLPPLTIIVDVVVGIILFAILELFKLARARVN